MRPRPSEGRSWPDDRDSLIDEFNRREASYAGDAYTDREARLYGLFISKSTSGQVLIPPRRIVGDQAYLVDVDVSAINSTSWTLRIKDDAIIPGADLPPPDAEGEVADRRRVSAEAERELWRLSGMQVWEQSGIEDKREEWARRYYCGLGRMGLWVTLTDNEACIVAMDPRHYIPRKDKLGKRLESVTIDMEYREPDSLDPSSGALVPGQWHPYRALIGAESIDVWDKGAKSAEESGDNLLGVPPFVTVDYAAGPDGVPLWSGHASEDGVAAVDSLFTQGLAIGGRHANPILRIGHELEASGTEDGPDLQGGPGRILEAEDANWLEATLTGANFLADLGTTVRRAYQETNPAYMFIDAGATASGTALSYRANAYIMQATPMRARFFRAVARSTAMAVCLERRIPWSESLDVFEVVAGPIIPADVQAVLGNILEARDGGVLLHSDAIEQAMQTGITPRSMDPEEYAQQVRIEVQPTPALDGLRALVDADGVPIEPEVEADTDEEPESKALLVGQITGAMSIVQQVAGGAIPRETGIASLINLIGLTSELAEEVMGQVGKGFVPTSLPGTLKAVEVKPAE